MASKDMRTVENMAPDALPETTDMRDGPHGAAKYTQIGAKATLSLLESAIKGSGISNTRGLIIMDLWARVGDSCQATLGGTNLVPWLFDFARGPVLQIRQPLLPCLPTAIVVPCQFAHATQSHQPSLPRVI